ncbi:MAG: hypothetical protein ACOZJX_06690 [Pseudomonadota bacterium]
MPYRPFAHAHALGAVVLAVALLPVARAQQVGPAARPQVEAAPQARLVAAPSPQEVARRLDEAVRELSALGNLVEARGAQIRCACPIGPPPQPVKPEVQAPRASLVALRRAIEVLAVIERNAQRGQDTEVVASPTER